ncbi:MAG: 3D domain-containing protein [Candidatus Calescibacterium sp.]|nr:3D domain-containing protein [Candidatus Calescibacterium sp.]
MKKSKFLFLSAIFVIAFWIVMHKRITFYSVNYYDKYGLCEQYIIPSFQGALPFRIDQEIYTVKYSQNSVDIYKDYEIEVRVDGKLKKIKTNFSESIKDIIDKIPVNRDFVILSADNKERRLNTISSPLLIDKCKIYTRKNLAVVFNRKSYTVSYFDFYSEKQIKYAVIQALRTELKNLRIGEIKDIDLVDLEEGFITVSSKNLYKVIGVNIVFIKREQVEIPFDTKFIYTPSLRQGQKIVVKKGKKGRMIKEYLVHVNYDGERTVELVNTDLLEGKQDEIIQIGISPMVDFEGKAYYIMESTGYTSGGGSVGFYTCTGHRVKRGIVAVDPSIIPLGTKLYIEGYGYGVALDKGSAIKGFKIDLYFETLQEAINWGRRKVKVFILKNDL